MCIIIGTQVPKTHDSDNVELSLASDTMLEEFFDAESETDETLGSEPGMCKTLASQSPFDKTLVYESGLDKTLVYESGLDNTQVSQSLFDKTLVSQSSLDKTQVYESGLDNAQVSQSLFDKTLVSQSSLDKTLVYESGLKKTVALEYSVDEPHVSESGLRKTPVDKLLLDKMRVAGLSFVKTLAYGSAFEKTLVPESGLGKIPVYESGFDKTPVIESDLRKTLVSESAFDKTLVLEPGLGKTPVYELGCGKTLASESSLGKTLVYESDLKKSIVSESGLGKTLVYESAFDKTLASESGSGKTPVSESGSGKTLAYELGSGKTLASELSFGKTLASKSGLGKPIVSDSAVRKTLVFDSAFNNAKLDEVVSEVLGTQSQMDRNLGEGFTMDDLEHSAEENSNGLSYSTCYGTDLSDSSTSHDARSPEDGDDMDDDNFGCFDMYGMPPHMWPHIRGFPFDPRCDPRHMHMMHMRQKLYMQQYPCPPYMRSHRSRYDELVNKQEWKGRSSYGCNSVEVDSDMVVGAGLCNLGNTCFLNAILQCFTHTVPLVEGLRSYNHPKHCKSDSEGFCVFCALHTHIELAITSTGKRISPLKIVENLNYLSSDFRRYQQEDAHELLQCLLDKLDQCCNSSESNDSDESLVNRLFGGRLVSKLKCCNCGHWSNTFESLIDLSLEIENVSSLTNALKSFTKVEKIEDEEPQFTCEGCDEKVTVEKQLMLDCAPSVAAFHLKRFKHDGARVEKIDKHIEFPLELDLKPFTGGDQNNNVDLSYNLYAIVVHSGFSPTSGHYFCYVRSASDTWYRLDDSQVTKVTEFHVLSQEAYILFYAKNGTPWFSTFMETEKTRLDSIVLTSSPKSVLETGNQSSDSSPSRESNIINEVFQEDQRKAMGIGEAKNELNTDRKSPPSPSLGEDLVNLNSSSTSVVDNMDQNFELSSIMETNIREVCKEAINDLNAAKKLPPISSRCDSSVISISSLKPVLANMDPNSESSPIIGTNIATNVDEKDKRYAVGIRMLPSIVINMDQPFNVEEAKISSDLNKENRGDNLEISILPLYERGFGKGVNEAKEYRKAETRLTSSALRGGNDSHRNGEFTEKAELNNSTSRESFSPVGLFKLSSDDCKLMEVNTVRRRRVGKSAAVDSSNFSGKEAYKAIKGLSCSRKRSRLMAALHNYHHLFFGNKRRKLNRLLSSKKKSGSLNALRNSNVVSRRHIVPRGRFR